MPSVSRVRVVRVQIDRPDALEQAVNDQLTELEQAGQDVMSVQFDGAGASGAGAWIAYLDFAGMREDKAQAIEQHRQDTQPEQASTEEYLRQSKERLDRFREARARADEEKERKVAADQELKSMVEAAATAKSEPAGTGS